VFERRMTSPETRNRIATDYVAALARDGARTYIANLETSVRLLDWGDHQLPLTVNDGERIGTFVCSPRIGYIDYPLEELARFPNQAVVPPLRALVGSVGAVLSLCDVDRIIHVNNWMFSTNLLVPLDLSLTGAMTQSLADNYPAHFLAMRSLTRRRNAELLVSLEAAGWVTVPSRQIFLVDDVERDLLPRRDSRHDERLRQRTEFVYDELTEMTDGDALRIAELYEMLYLEKYSRLNPAYTPRFIKLAHAIGLLKFLVFRDGDGVIQSFGGMQHAGQNATMPLLGYNTAMDQKHGLYRLACHAGARYAAREKLFFNMSSGATGFKRSRGATPEMEYTAYYLRHLPPSRRIPFGVLRAVANRIGAPLLRKYEL
jgi:hypothetical protein